MGPARTDQDPPARRVESGWGWCACRYLLLTLLTFASASCMDRGVEPPPIPDAPDFGDFDLGDCLEGPIAPTTSGHQVTYAAMSIDQPFLIIRIGDTVTWTNSDSVAHTVTAGEPEAELPVQEGGFESGNLRSGDRWAFRFCSPRQIVYFCRTHPAQMRGYRIIVNP